MEIFFNIFAAIFDDFLEVECGCAKVLPNFKEFSKSDKKNWNIEKKNLRSSIAPNANYIFWMWVCKFKFVLFIFIHILKEKLLKNRYLAIISCLIFLKFFFASFLKNGLYDGILILHLQNAFYTFRVCIEKKNTIVELSIRKNIM